MFINMRIYAQILSICFTICAAFPNTLNDASFEGPIYTNTIHRYTQNQESPQHEPRPLKKVFLSNRSITCNDGSQAGFYLRKSHTSKKWIIFLEGGWYCYDHYSCRNRWLRQRHYMTSSQWPETKDVGGILSSNIAENPFWWNANHVFVPYCSSDSWSGSRPMKHGEMFSFMGSSIVRQVVRDLVPLGLENSTDLMLTGSSAGGTGVMLNLDPVHELLHDVMHLKHIAVRGVTDSGWFLDRIPYVPSSKPAVEAVRKGMQLWQGKVPLACREQYFNEPWRCYFGYRLYPTLKSELFVFQWLFDEAQMDADNVGAPVSKQQWDYIHKMGDALRQSFENVTAVFAPSCISHSVLTKKDWQNVKIDDISIAEALHCWEQKTNRRRQKRLNNILGDQPRLKRRRKNQGKTDLANKTNNSTIPTSSNGRPKNGRRKKNGKNRKNRKGHKKQKDNKSPSHPPLDISSNNNKNPNVNKRSPNHPKRLNSRHCTHRRLERCSWPQCNHSCPKLHNPVTGEEMDFIELLKSFGLDMESVANALGIDMQTLNNMDQTELLNLLTQQSN